MHPASPSSRPIRPTAVLAVLALALLTLSTATNPEPAAPPTPCQYLEVPVERVEVLSEAPDDPEPLPMRTQVDGRDPFTAPPAPLGR